MAASRKYQLSFSSLKSVVHFQQRRRFSDSLIETTRSMLPNPPPEPPMISDSGHVDYSKWKRWNSRSLGIPLSRIPDSSRIVLRLLQSKGYGAYLVGGCVRDLLLNRAPKDFDVVTTASLIEIKTVFHRAIIIGRKFPICKVHVKGSAIEVSSFETVARNATKKEDVNLTELPKGYDAKDVLLWKDSSRRDFTINSLFYDPYAQRIYDYSNGLTDLKGMKLRTLAPAHLSFKEDCARILRGIRIAARLGFSFSNDTERAIRSLYASVATLDKGRLDMELNYMLSYGAAEHSLYLLKRFEILEFLLPFQAAYLDEYNRNQNHIMLMKLFCNLDSVTSCDQPCTSSLWVSLLAFHLALVNNPQDAIVVWAFSSILYHGSWEEGVKAVREQSIGPVHFTPEIVNSSGDDETDEALSRRVDDFALKVRDSIYMLTDSKSLRAIMKHHPSTQSTDFVLISNNVRRDVYEIFCGMTEEMELLREKRRYYNINYDLLGRGDILETRFALGKIILDTMRHGLMYGQTKEEEVKKVKVEKLTSSISKLETPKGKDGAKRGHSVLDEQKPQPKAKDDLHTPKPKVKKVQVEKSTSKLETPKAKDGAKRGRSVIDKRKHQPKAKDDLHTPKPKVKKVQVEKSTSSTSKLETPKGKDEVKRGRSVLDEQKHQPKAKKQKAKTQTIDSEQKCVENTLEEILTRQRIEQKNVKLGLKKHCESQTSDKIHSGLQKVPSPEMIFSILEMVPQRKKQLKDQHPGNVSSLSNTFKRDKYPTKKDNREEKQATVGDKSIGVKVVRKLSGLFR